jgi:hypothetical protein
MSDLKAISMNLMHAGLAVTDRTYAVLSDRDVHERIARLGQRPSVEACSADTNALKEALREVLVRLG